MRVDRLDLAIILALVIACAAIYAQTASFEFVGYDDEAHVTLNAVTQRGLALDALGPALTATVAANWHPVTQLSHMLDIELFGLAPGGHHATNVLLHMLATLLLFGVMRDATGARWRSAFVAGLFAVHPLHVEVVAWVSQRKTLLCTVFGLASMWAYVRYTRAGGSGRFALSAGLLGAGLLAKPMLVTLPLLLVLMDFWPLGRVRSWREAAGLAREKLALIVPAVAIGVVAIVAQRSQGAMAPFAADRFFGTQLPNAILGYVWYLKKAIWPSELAVHYPHPYIPTAGGVPPDVSELWAAAALLVAIVVVAVFVRRRRPWLAFGAVWVAVALLPVIGLLQVGTQAVADRYAYLTLVGLFVALAWEANTLCDRLRLPLPVVAAVALAVLVAYGAAAHRQAAYWQSSRSLYTRALEISPSDVAMLFNLGNAELADGRVDPAEDHYRRALAIHPGNSPAQLNLAELLRKHGAPEDLAESISLYRSVLADRPGNRRATRGHVKALLAAAEADND